ncbi:hypothetical protein [Niveispirillum fermenti]|uniref:hypothetical protein n=1 Tax=Niveispirillum fermenti TaxID=1233113 RepID=UPI003A8BB921
MPKAVLPPRVRQMGREIRNTPANPLRRNDELTEIKAMLIVTRHVCPRWPVGNVGTLRDKPSRGVL